MILDTSCIIAVLTKEPETERFTDLISNAAACRISAAAYVEVFLVLSSHYPKKVPYCDNLIQDTSIIIEPVTIEQAYLARRAFHHFGKGRHPAGLNYGDCFSYALAKATGEPLLFKGEDFAKTDVIPASAS